MNIKFEKNNYGDVPKLKELWIDIFGEKLEAAELFFKRCVDFTPFYTAKAENEPVSMLFLINAELNGKKAHYLCGAATSEKYRRLGIMGALIEYALDDARKNGDVYSLLFPAGESLYGYYERFGYNPLCTAEKTEFSREQLEKFSGCREETVSSDTEELQKITFKNNFLLQNNKFLSFASEYYGVYGCKTLKSKNCFAIADIDGAAADVFYSLYSDFSILAKKLLEETDAERFVFTGKSGNFKNSQTEKHGMIKSLDNTAEIPNDVYIGITLS